MGRALVNQGQNMGVCARAFVLAKYAAALALVLMMINPRAAQAVPAFAQQTGQPCAACHVGAFGPQLKQYGRDFKLNGYLAADGQDTRLPIAVTTQLSFTHTNADQNPPTPHYAGNNNFNDDQTSLYYGGRITPWLGAFIQVTYDGTARQVHIDNTDIRVARDTDLFDEDLIYGFTANNSPTVSDLWNSTPVWGFPYNSSALAPTPLAATLIDGGLAQRVVGVGSYAMWNNLVYLEADVYQGLGYQALNATGIVPVTGTDKTRGAIPYWRLALQRDYGRSYFQVGTYGIHADLLPGGIEVAGLTDSYTDTAADANYQFTFNPNSVTSDIISAHATFIHEDALLNASSVISGSRPVHELNTVRADVSYAIAATVTPTIQYFQTTGTGDINYYDTPNGRPDSKGMIYEIAYVPFGKPDSIISWGNIRLAAQYVSYFQFNGVTKHAADNNALYLNIWAAAHF
jgi:hypothetical protein